MSDHTLIFNDNDLQILNTALMQMPYGQVAPLVIKINTQLQKETSQTSQEALAA